MKKHERMEMLARRSAMREETVLALHQKGFPTKDISNAIGLAQRTVQKYAAGVRQERIPCYQKALFDGVRQWAYGNWQNTSSYPEFLHAVTIKAEDESRRFLTPQPKHMADKIARWTWFVLRGNILSGRTRNARYGAGAR